ncbi:hypothetical protein SDC9_55864 [bioreactor metagenome]|uniref:Uncharacterized protein n=1 Tax=bioreactor metagenome TaxID=1076179 RepID=A0A644X5V2_9ZZZZ
MKISALIMFALVALFCTAQPEHTRCIKIKLKQTDDSFSLHCRKGKYIISFNPADLTYPFADEKKNMLEAFLNRTDTLSLDTMIEKATEIVRDSTMDFCSIRFNSVVSRNFINGNIAVKNSETNSFLKRISALIDDRMSWMLVNYYYFTDPKKSTILFEYCDVSFGCPAF